MVPQRLSQLAERSIHIALVVETRGQVGSCRDILGVSLHSFSVIILCLFELMSRLVQRSELVEQGRIIGVVLELLEQWFGLLVRHALHVIERWHLLRHARSGRGTASWRRLSYRG